MQSMLHVSCLLMLIFPFEVNDNHDLQVLIMVYYSLLMRIFHVISTDCVLIYMIFMNHLQNK